MRIRVVTRCLRSIYPALPCRSRGFERADRRLTEGYGRRRKSSPLRGAAGRGIDRMMIADCRFGLPALRAAGAHASRDRLSHQPHGRWEDTKN